jgi:flagellin
LSSVASINVGNQSGASSAISVVDGALSFVDDLRATLGAIQNRFSSAVSSAQTTAENVSGARSRIQDADFAAETANMTKAQVLQQAGTAILAQANQAPQGVLSLLR